MKTKKIYQLLILTSIALFTLLFSSNAYASTLYNDPWEGLWEAGFALPDKNLGSFIGIIIRYVLGVIGIILIILLILGGFMYMTSQGNEESIEKSKKLLTAAIVGLIIVAVSYIIADYVISTVFPYPYGN